MRTTLNIDDDLVRTAKSIAERRKVSLGAVVSELMRTGLERTTTYRVVDGLPVFQVSEEVRSFTLEDVRSAEDEA